MSRIPRRARRASRWPSRAARLKSSSQMPGGPAGHLLFGPDNTLYAPPRHSCQNLLDRNVPPAVVVTRTVNRCSRNRCILLGRSLGWRQTRSGHVPCSSTGRPSRRISLARSREPQCRVGSLTFETVGNSTSREVEMTVIERLKFLDWTFSATAEAVVGGLLALIIVLMVFV